MSAVLEATLPDLSALPEIREAVTADVRGRLLQTTGEEEPALRGAARTAAVVRELAALGPELGLGRLDSFVARGAGQTIVTAARNDLFVRVTLDPAHGTAQVERALGEWNPARAGGTAADPPGGEESVGASDLGASLAEAASRATAAINPWAELRHRFVRGLLTDASALRGQLGQEPSVPALPGAEPLDPPAREHAMDVLLEGIGSILAGDVLGGVRTLKPLASPPHPNLSVRWLSMHWSAMGALRCNGLAAARWFAREALLVARQLDVEALATSQWAVAEVLAAEGDGTRALTWAAEARIRFERLGEPWGLGRACFAEARILCGMDREGEAVEAARRAWAHDPGWDEPAAFLAHRALLRGAPGDAEEAVRTVGTAAADRIRLLVSAIQQGTVTSADAAEVLRLQAAPPTVESLQGLERIARASQLVVAREALAWVLLRVGRYADAGQHFQALAATALTPAVRSSVMLGLGCVAHAHQGAPRPDATSPAARPAEAVASAPGADPAESPRPGGSSLSGLMGGPGAVFAGKLNVFAVPDLLEFLRGARRTGLLVCSSVAGTATLRFREGRIAGASSPTTPGVGELLVRARKLSPVALQTVLERHAGRTRTDGGIAAALLRDALVGADELQAALREQIQLAVRELVAWRDGEFAFNNPQGEEEAVGVPVEVDPQEVLLNALKEMDEASRARGPA